MDNKFKPLPFIFLVLMIGLTWYLFFELDILADNEKRLTGIVAILGLTFGLFQFWVSEINNNKRRQFDLRYESYKELVSMIDAISETLNQEMADQTQNPHAVVSKLINLINQYESAIKMNSDYLFKGLNKREESTIVSDILQKILIRTDQFRKEIDDAAKRNPDQTAILLVTVVGQMNWHNETRESLKQLHNSKYSFYDIVRTYF